MMLIILTPLMIFAPQLTALFNRDPEVVGFGAMFIRMISPFYLAFAVNQVYLGALRGAGDTKATMLIALGSFVLFRQLYLYISYRLGGGSPPWPWVIPRAGCSAAPFCFSTTTAGKRKPAQAG